MLTITSEAFHDKLHVANEEIILNGPPNDMRGHILIRNTQAEPLRVRTLPMVHDKKAAAMMNQSAQLRVSGRLDPGEEKLTSLFLQLRRDTPPGIYESSLLVGGHSRKLKMVVQSHISIDISPKNFSFQDSSPGKVHTAQFTLTNLGNIPFQVPEVKHIATLDMDFLCRSFGFALREKGAEGYIPTMDQITRNIQGSLPDWSSAKVKEIGKTLAPGESMVIHLDIILPANSDPKKDYSGDMRFWDKDISFLIKSHNEKK